MNSIPSCACIQALQNRSPEILQQAIEDGKDPNGKYDSFRRDHLKEHFSDDSRFGKFSVAVTKSYNEYLKSRARNGDLNLFGRIYTQISKHDSSVSEGLKLRAVYTLLSDQLANIYGANIQDGDEGSRNQLERVESLHAMLNVYLSSPSLLVQKNEK